MKVAYIAHPFLGKPENVKSVEDIMRKLMAKYQNYALYSPLHSIVGILYNELSYEVGMEHCYEFLKRSDALWLCQGWQKSRGCNLECAFNVFLSLHIGKIIIRNY